MGESHRKTEHDFAENSKKTLFFIEKYGNYLMHLRVIFADFLCIIINDAAYISRKACAILRNFCENVICKKKTPIQPIWLYGSIFEGLLLFLEFRLSRLCCTPLPALRRSRNGRLRCSAGITVAAAERTSLSGQGSAAASKPLRWYRMRNA